MFRVSGRMQIECVDTIKELIEMDACDSQDEVGVKLFAHIATDEILVRAAKSGDRYAFAELWERQSNTAFKVAYRIMKNRDDADDAIQDACMKAHVHLTTFDGREKFSTWLTRIVNNLALMTLRKKDTRPETSMEIADGKTRQQWEIADQNEEC